MKIAWPCPVFMVVKHIAQVLLEDLVPVLGNRRPEDDGVGVVGRQSEPAPIGESREEDETASDNTDAAASFDADGGSSLV